MKRKREKQWSDFYDTIPAKVGTVPMSIWVDKDLVLSEEVIGEKIYFYEMEFGRKCGGIVEKLDPILFLTRM